MSVILCCICEENICTIPTIPDGDSNQGEGSADDGFDFAVTTHCGHLYHNICIFKWFESEICQSQGQCCPSCKKEVDTAANGLIRIYPSLEESNNSDADLVPISKLDEYFNEMEQLRETNGYLTRIIDSNAEEISTLEVELDDLRRGPKSIRSAGSAENLMPGESEECRNASLPRPTSSKAAQPLGAEGPLVVAKPTTHGKIGKPKRRAPSRPAQVGDLIVWVHDRSGTIIKQCDVDGVRCAEIELDERLNLLDRPGQQYFQSKPEMTFVAPMREIVLWEDYMMTRSSNFLKSTASSFIEASPGSSNAARMVTKSDEGEHNLMTPGVGQNRVADTDCRRVDGGDCQTGRRTARLKEIIEKYKRLGVRKDGGQ